MRSLVAGLVLALAPAPAHVEGGPGRPGGELASARTLTEYVALLPPVTLSAEPGTKWAYSNVNYNVAARRLSSGCWPRSHWARWDWVCWD